MGNKGESNRQRIVEAADELFYTRGFHQTSFRDISDATDIPRGNFYYYFKTKEEILTAVVDARVQTFGDIMKDCEQKSDDPKERILCFSNILSMFEDNVIAVGCPVGTLCSELAKDNKELQEISRAVFILMRDWLTEQFSALKCENAEEKAMDMLARIQGITVMASTFKDRDFVHRSLSDLQNWIKVQSAN